MTNQHKCDVLQRPISQPSVATPEAAHFPKPTRPAVQADEKVILDLQKKFSNQIGFIPRGMIPLFIGMNGLHLALENHEPCGVMLSRPLLQTAPLIRPIIQAAVYMDARRRQHGFDLIHRNIIDALKIGTHALQAICREGMECNEFWKAAGFQMIAKLDRPNARRRIMHVWRLWLPSTPVEPFFYVPPSHAGCRGQRAELHESMHGGQYRLFQR